MGLPRSSRPSPWSLLLAALASAGLAGAAAALAAGCGPNRFECQIPSRFEVTADGGPDPCHCAVPESLNAQGCDCFSTPQGTTDFNICVLNLCESPAEAGGDPSSPLCAKQGSDADGPPPGCTGECLPSAPLGWSEPVLAWFGTESGAPACPDVAPRVGYEGHAGLNAPPATCGTCSCQPPQGSCSPPATVTASTAPCSGSGSPVPLDPVKWDGPCAPIDTMSAASIGSLSIGPLTLHESGCSPAQPASEIAPLGWATFARACEGTTYGVCESPGDTCSPGADGFRRCIFHEGVQPCEAVFDPYVEQHVFYEEAVDTRGCSECSCQPPAGGTCSGSVSIYGDGTCGVALTPDAGDASSLTLLCLDVLAGSNPGSALLGPEIYSPGACQPDGGAATGAAEPTSPVTFCCITADGGR